jgi:pullulanase/glycogen debranching enzyme
MSIQKMVANRWLRCGVSLALAWAAAPVQAFDACDDPNFARQLHPQRDAAPLAAQAYWLNRSLIQWPGAAADTGAGARSKLYYSAKATLHLGADHAVSGADGALSLEPITESLSADLAQRFKFIATGPRWQLGAADLSRLPDLLRAQVWLVQESADGAVLAHTRLQAAGALDDLYAAAEQVNDLGASPDRQTSFKLWAPTAQNVALCRYPSGSDKAVAKDSMHRDAPTGVWQTKLTGDLSGQYYSYLVDVFVPGLGVVRNRVTDPYSISLTTDSKRSYVADLQRTALKPPGWDASARPQRVKTATDMVIYELHVRDFSISDATVPAAKRGKYSAFTQSGSAGMRHLQALAKAGLTDVHLLPVFDIASIPEAGCLTPKVPKAAPASEAQQAAVMAVAAEDCFNWGYDPFHYSAPEGSYASDAAKGERRIIEFREMVTALHKADLRVGMDVVYNHTAAAGQHEKSVLDRIVPGYYQRLNANGEVERSTCCDNTATEHRMMAKLMLDSVALWAREYKIDSFRFDLMAHQPRAVMEALQQRVNQAAGRPVQLIGEGWNFGEVANGARFVQASQLSLNGSGIATFSDRGRDAARGGSAGDGGLAVIKNQGWLNGLVYAPNAIAKQSPQRPLADLQQAADLIRVGLAGSLRDYELQTWQGKTLKLADIAYGDQPAGYVSQPGEVVNYVDNHDNQTLFDINVLKLPRDTSAAERARVQILGLALTAFSQGVAYYHAGVDVLRSKSLDRNSYDSGDWFNRLDWGYRDNGFAAGLPPKLDNGDQYPLLAPLLTDASVKPSPADIAWTRDAFRDLLKIRASSSLFRLPTAEEVKRRLTFLNTGSAQNPRVVVASLDGRGWPGAGFEQIVYFINVDPAAQSLDLPKDVANAGLVLHPVHLNANAADKRIAAEARFDPGTGRFTLPGRSAVVFVRRH